ncbi:MAG: penicillin-binding protein 2 [Candidatus Sungbacteria bacterium]|nr:penicillin-binding protein 2 [Candidatus Sungbacteria bacterium]
MRWSLRNKSGNRGGEIQPEEIFADTLHSAEFDSMRLEGQIEYSLSQLPFRMGALVVLLGFSALLLRAGTLQVIQGAALAERAEYNHVFAVELPAPRGIIFDRYREELVRNAPVFEAVLRSSEVPDDEEKRESLFRALTEVLGISEDAFAEVRFSSAEEKKHLPKEIVLASDVSREAVVEIEARSSRFPGVVIRERELRDYVEGPAFMHVVGYIGKISDTELKEEVGYSPSSLIGKTGIEAMYEEKLRGTPGQKLVEVNASHTPVGELPSLRPVIGKSLILHIDAGLQRMLHESLSHELAAAGKAAGSAVAIDPRNGAVRALVSLPSFDPNIFRGRISPEEYRKIFLASSKPLFNRAISGEYPSGSVIKPLVAAAALEENIIDPLTKIYDSGSIAVPNPYRPGEETIFPDWRAHGLIDMRAALQWSANVYFYIVGGGYKDIQGLGIRKLGEYMRKFGLGAKLGIDLPGETTGLVPDPDTIVKTRPGDPIWRIGDTYQTAIGQGSFQATPLQIAAMTAVVANGGTLWKPQVAGAILDERGNVEETIEPAALASHIAKSQSLQVVREGMRLVATEGTARAFFSEFPVEVAGKTGTAQTGFLTNTHGWFSAFAPYREPELVVVVMAEDVRANTGIAPRVVRDALYWYFTEGRHH